MLKRKASLLLLASAFLMPMAAAAKDDGVSTTTAGKGGAVTAGALVERYSALLGSPENAKSLVNGLRSQSEVVLVGPSSAPSRCIPGRPCPPSNETVKFTPPTEPMGFGNVDLALAMMEADLKGKSVTSVKPRHIKAALVGGEPVGGITFEGILKLRAEGKGWGEIADLLGFKLK